MFWRFWSDHNYANDVSSINHDSSFFVAHRPKNPGIGKQRKPPVELWCVGDDVFSKGICQALFAAFESSPYFNLQEEKKLGNLIVTIPENVGWKEVGKRTKITYVVKFSTSDERVFMTRKGWCWHEEYAKCANLILKEAKVAARKLPR